MKAVYFDLPYFKRNTVGIHVYFYNDYWYLTNMSLGDKAVLICVICWSYKVVMTGCEVVLVHRNVTDSFRVGKDGCANDTSVCPSSSTCQPHSGLCLCGNLPNFGNPKVEDAGGYKCVRSNDIQEGLDGLGIHCGFTPFQLIPYTHDEPATQFTQTNKMTSCSLDKSLKTQAKFPNITNNMELQWLDASYVQFSVSNKILSFKWKRSVPGLRGTIITLYPRCQQGNSYRTTCLRAKVSGTWPPEVVPGTTESTVISTQPSLSQKTSNLTVPVTVTTVTTVKPESTHSGSSNKVRSDPNVSNTALIAALAVSLIVNVVLGLVDAFLWNKMKRIQSNDLTSKEMKNIGEQGKENAEDEIDTYDEVETYRGKHNDGMYDDSIPSSTQNNNASSLDHQYEETSNYEPLRKNPLQDESDDHHYQSLTTSHKRE